jgi:hypothetical protein
LGFFQESGTNQLIKYHDSKSNEPRSQGIPQKILMTVMIVILDELVSTRFLEKTLRLQIKSVNQRRQYSMSPKQVRNGKQLCRGGG